MDRLLLIRHGITRAVEDWLYCGATDLSLSPAGREALISGRDSYIWPDLNGWSIYTSGMRRAEETLEILLGNIPHSPLPAFREMDFGVFEMHSYDELKIREDYQAWISGDNEANVCPGGESGLQMKARVFAGLRELTQAPGSALVVCHGGPIVAVMQHLFPQENRTRYDWQPAGGCGYLITFDGCLPVSYEPFPGIVSADRA